MKFLFRMCLLVVMVTMCLPFGACSQHEPEMLSSTAPQPRFRNKMMVLPVSVHLLTFAENEQLNPHYTDADIARLFEEVNAVWNKWGINWQVESINTVPVAAKDFKIPEAGFARPREFRNAAASLIPDASSDRRWRVYLVRQFPVAGSAVYVIEKRAVLYGELNKSGDRYPVILAHELGHSLGLRHVPMPGNLMYAGPDKTPDPALKLTPVQIRQARRQAVKGPVHLNPGDRRYKSRRPVVN